MWDVSSSCMFVPEAPCLWSPPERAQQGRGRWRVCLGVHAVGTSSESRTAAAVQGAALAAQQRDGMA